MTAQMTIAVMAKTPVPGRVKTRLCPPCTPDQAASLARAALEDTLDAVTSVVGARPVLVLDGDPAEWADRVAIVPQRGRGLDERLAAAFADLGGPTVLVGMDTPQVAALQLGAAVAQLRVPGTGAVLGPASDGGYWLIGLPAPDDGAFLGVPMSTATTGAAQLARLRGQGRRVELAPVLRDVDLWDDALAVAASAPATRFARAVGALTPELLTQVDDV
jgi:rSAM/selenodomain-associated transferase 1